MAQPCEGLDLPLEQPERVILDVPAAAGWSTDPHVLRVDGDRAIGLGALLDGRGMKEPPIPLA